LLAQLRTLAADFGPSDDTSSPSPLAPFYRDTVAMIDTALRTVSLLPDSATVQLRICQGLEVTLDVVATRLRTLLSGVQRHRQEIERIERLADLLIALHGGKSAAGPFLELAEQTLTDARECGPLRFLEGDPGRPAHCVACHSLTVAQVIARLVQQDPELRHRPQDAILAALVHDVGMLNVPAEVFAQAGPLTEEQRRAVEAHCRLGAERVAGQWPDGAGLAESVEGHHERLDGTGYPDGLRESRIRSLTRLLAVCDVYAALCTARPHRQARGTRTALADTLVLAEQGLLDRQHAEALLHLSFYPVGSVVELAHGAIGVVVATPGPRRDLSSPARPVVALLTDAQGEPLARPHHLDLARCDTHSIVRTLTARERHELLEERFPEWAA
jgi:hypothetical protein